MFFKKTQQHVPTADLDAPGTVIGKGIYLEAIRMTGQESIRIDGTFKGEIDIDSSLVLGDTGNIIGDVNANYFLVAGQVDGSINCNTQLHVASSAKVVGDIQTPSLVVDEGCQLFGRCNVIGNKNPQDLLQDRDGILHISTAEDEDDEE